MSLIGLNNNEIKKNEMKPMLAEEMKNAKGGFKCFFIPCICFCSPASDYFDDGANLSNLQYIWNRDN